MVRLGVVVRLRFGTKLYMYPDGYKLLFPCSRLLDVLLFSTKEIA